jgi:hypothetical protein
LEIKKPGRKTEHLTSAVSFFSSLEIQIEKKEYDRHQEQRPSCLKDEPAYTKQVFQVFSFLVKFGCLFFIILHYFIIVKIK